MSFLILAGAEVAERAADLLRESILDRDGDLGQYMARLNLALVRYSAAKHQEGDVAIALGEIDEPEPGA